MLIGLLAASLPELPSLQQLQLAVTMVIYCTLFVWSLYSTCCPFLHITSLKQTTLKSKFQVPLKVCFRRRIFILSVLFYTYTYWRKGLKIYYFATWTQSLHLYRVNTVALVTKTMNLSSRFFPSYFHLFSWAVAMTAVHLHVSSMSRKCFNTQSFLYLH